MSAQQQIDRLIAFRAAEWFELRKSEPGRHNEEFLQWISESPRHLEALLDTASQAPLIRDACAEALRGNNGKLGEKPGADISRLAVVPIDSTFPQHLATPRKQRRKSTVRTLAAALAAVSLGAILFFAFQPGERFETRIGEQRSVKLAEGSVVNLNALSRLDVHFDHSQRDIRLRGEATFKVTADPRRPFRVHTTLAVVEAVGTQFNVYAKADGTTMVSVLSGKVKVARDGPKTLQASTAPLPLDAGETARILSSGTIERDDLVDVSDAILWQQRRLIFKRTSLQEMAAEFNRYNKSTRIRVEDVDPQRFRFTGTFNADDPHSLAALLMREPDLSVEQSVGEIVIRGK